MQEQLAREESIAHYQEFVMGTMVYQGYQEDYQGVCQR